MKKSIVIIFLLLAVIMIAAAGCSAATPAASSAAAPSVAPASTAVSAAPASSAAASGASADTTTYKYGKTDIQALSGAVCGAPAYIAKEKGFFAKEGFDVTLVSGTFETQKAGLSSGKYIITNGDFQFFPSVQQGLKLRVVGALHTGCITLVVPKGSPIKTVDDLKGKKIGIDEPGGTPQSVATVLLANHNIDPQKGVEWVTYQSDQLVTAATKGEIDAFINWDPFGTLAVRDNGFTKIFDLNTDPLFTGKPCCFLWASQKAIDENPDAVAALVRAFKEADDWIRANPAEAAKIIINKKYVATDDTSLVQQLIESYGYNFETTKAKDDVQYFAEQFKKTGFLDASTDPQKFANDIYYDALGAAKK